VRLGEGAERRRSSYEEHCIMTNTFLQ
jgi:hypothetical protein